MRTQRTLVLLAALGLPWMAHGEAKPARVPAGITLAQGETAAVELRQGMTAEDVQKLLGKPRRTSLRGDPGPGSQGTLKWSYSWSGGTGPSNLNVEFVSTGAEAWSVRSWEWAAY